MSLITAIWNAYKSRQMDEAFKIALSQYDVTEWAGDKHNPDVMKYFTECGFPTIKDDETSWCSAFMCWCVQKAGMKHTGSLAARSWLNWGEKVFDPQPGDIAVFWRNEPRGWQGHVGFFVRQSGDRVWTLGGNQSNKVCIDDYPGAQLLGYRRALA